MALEGLGQNQPRFDEEHRQKARTPEELLEFIGDQSLQDLRDNGGKTPGREVQLGPIEVEAGKMPVYVPEEFRYVQDPADPAQVIDMTHFFSAADKGPLGEELGLLAETEQTLPSEERGGRGLPSAFMKEDLRSNDLGDQFGTERMVNGVVRPGQSLHDQLDTFFEQRKDDNPEGIPGQFREAAEAVQRTFNGLVRRGDSQPEQQEIENTPVTAEDSSSEMRGPAYDLAKAAGPGQRDVSNALKFGINAEEIAVKGAKNSGIPNPAGITKQEIVDQKNQAGVIGVGQNLASSWHNFQEGDFFEAGGRFIKAGAEALNTRGYSIGQEENKSLGGSGGGALFNTIGNLSNAWQEVENFGTEKFNLLNGLAHGGRAVGDGLKTIEKLGSELTNMTGGRLNDLAKDTLENFGGWSKVVNGGVNLTQGSINVFAKEGTEEKVSSAVQAANGLAETTLGAVQLNEISPRIGDTAASVANKISPGLAQKATNFLGNAGPTLGSVAEGAAVFELLRTADQVVTGGAALDFTVNTVAGGYATAMNAVAATVDAGDELLHGDFDGAGSEFQERFGEEQKYINQAIYENWQEANQTLESHLKDTYLRPLNELTDQNLGQTVENTFGAVLHAAEGNYDLAGQDAQHALRNAGETVESWGDNMTAAWSQTGEDLGIDENSRELVGDLAGAIFNPLGAVEQAANESGFTQQIEQMTQDGLAIAQDGFSDAQEKFGNFLSDLNPFDGEEAPPSSDHGDEDYWPDIDEQPSDGMHDEFGAYLDDTVMAQDDQIDPALYGDDPSLAFQGDDDELNEMLDPSLYDSEEDLENYPADDEATQQAYDFEQQEQEEQEVQEQEAQQAQAEQEEAEQQKVQAELEAQQQAELEAQQQAELEAQRQAELEARRQAELEARRQAEEEARRQAEEAARQAAEEAARQAAIAQAQGEG